MTPDNPSALVDGYLRLIGMARTKPLPPAAAPGGVCAIFSPHPDDECIIGALPLRLRREAGMRIVNVPVTLGSHQERKAVRRAELQQACDKLGFEIAEPAAHCFDLVRPETKTAQPIYWDGMVMKLAALIERLQPDILLLPHRHDGHPTHGGTHHLVMDALAGLPPDFKATLVFTEYWQPQADPNLMVESPPDDVVRMVEALMCHAGEIARSPYHRTLPAWMIDNARRGAELVGGFGAAAGVAFATLYQYGVWQDGAYHIGDDRLLPADHSAASLMSKPA